jgi:hypothetical protein
MSELSAVLDELAAGAPVAALSWSDVEARSKVNRRPRQSRRRRIIALLAAAVALSIAGAAVGVGITLLDQQELFHEAAPDDPARLGPLVEITAGDNWALIAWQSKFGVCLDFAIPGNSPFGCGFPVRGAKPATDSSGSGPPVHAIAGQVSGGGLVGGDGKTTIFGVAAKDVAAVKLHLRDGRILDAALFDAPPELKAEVRFFIARSLLPPTQREPGDRTRAYGPGGASLATDNPVRAFIAYDRDGNIMERIED